MVTSKDDLDAMLERSYLAGVKSMIITGGSLHESELALNLAHQKGWSPLSGDMPFSYSARNRALCDRRVSSNTFRGV
jgi:Tat protein secretion system quality control protein TatD with DNase activity